jgi:hypothetical protein
VGDFNGDGNLDLAVAENGSSGVSVLLGNGNGGFGNPSIIALPGYALSVAVGDFNGDGKLDLVATTATYSPPSYYGSYVTGSQVTVLMGNGNGTFAPGVSNSLPTPTTVAAVAVGDLNRDGRADLVVTDGNEVSVLLGNGNGTFGNALNFPAGSAAQSVAVADFNRDGWPDVAVINHNVAGTVSVLQNPGEGGALGVGGFPSTTTAGLAGSFTVTAHNSDGSIDTGFTGTVHFASSDSQAILPANYTFTAADAGVHTFSAILKTAGTQAITVADTTGALGSSVDAGINVSPAAASALSITGFPSPITAGVAGALTVTLRDPYGNIATGYFGTVHFTSSDRQASLPANYTFTANDAGVHTFSATLKTAGTQSITALDTTTASIAGTDAAIAVNPAAAFQFVIIAPTSITAGTRFTLTVKVEDAYGNVVTGYRGTIHFSSTDSTASLPRNYTFSATDQGVHTFTGLILRKKGNQKITITDTLNSLLTGSAMVGVL